MYQNLFWTIYFLCIWKSAIQCSCHFSCIKCKTFLLLTMKSKSLTTAHLNNYNFISRRDVPAGNVVVRLRETRWSRWRPPAGPWRPSSRRRRQSPWPWPPWKPRPPRPWTSAATLASEHPYCKIKTHIKKGIFEKKLNNNKHVTLKFIFCCWFCFGNRGKDRVKG